MEHVVFYPGPDGTPAFRRCSSLEEAVGFVEHLRNAEGVAEVSVHLLTPVPVAFRPYYRVEVPAGEVAEFPAVPEQPVAEEVPAESLIAAAPDMEMPGVEMAGPDGPAMEVPGLDVPGLEVPGLEVPGLDVPGLEQVPELVDAVVADGDGPVEGKRTLGFFAQ